MILLSHNIQNLQGFNVSAKELLNILSGMRLGQVIRGKVISVLSTGEILALINGQKIKAQSNLYLEEGDILYLKVMSLKPSILLRLYGIDSVTNADPISKVLRMFNLEGGQLNSKIVSMMIKNNLSIDKGEIQKIAETLNNIKSLLAEIDVSKEFDSEDNRLLFLARQSGIPVNEDNLIEAMFFLKSKNIPISLKSALIALNFLNKDTDLASNLTGLFDILKNFKTVTIKQDISNLSALSIDEKLQIEQIIKNIGYDYERKLSEFHPESRKEFIEELTLKGLTLELINNFRTYENLENSDKLLLLALKILNNIEFHQLLNSDDSGEIKNWYFQFPVNIENENKTVELKIAGKNKKSSKISKVPYSFNLSVDLSSLGKVRSHGSLYQNSLSLSFYLCDEKNVDLFKSDIDHLKSKLSELGVNLQSSNVEFDSQDAGIENRKIFNEQSTSINIRA